MKHSILILALFIFVIPACKKEKKEEAKPSTTTEKQRMLMGKNWKISKLVSEGQDMTSVIPACVMDNVIFHFSDTKSGYADEGPQKCDVGDSQLTNFDWSLIAGETKLVIDDHTSKDTMLLLQLSNTEMQLGMEEDTMTLKW